jgi:hypothetical protein
MREILDDLVGYLQETALSHGKPIIPDQAEEVELTKPFASQSRMKLKQDSTICALYCPMKRK